MKVLRPAEHDAVPWNEIEVRHARRSGSVELELSGRAAELAAEARARRAQPPASPTRASSPPRSWSPRWPAQPMSEPMTDEIRRILKEHGRLPVDVDALADDADLYQAGMTSHASVNVMLGARGRLRRRVPRRDAQAQRLREHRARSPRRSTELASEAGRHDASPSTATRPSSTPSAGSPTRSPRRNADDVDREARFPVETIDALREAAARCRRFVPTELGGGGVSFEAIAAGLLRARPPLRRQRDGLRHAPDPGRHASSATSTARRGSRTTCASVAAEQRLVASVTSEVGTGGDMGRSVAARRRPAEDGRLQLREAGADGLLRRLRRRPAHHRCAARPDAEPGDQVARPDPRATSTQLEQTGHLGPARDARHVLARLRRRAPTFAAEQVLADAVLDASRPSRWSRSRTSSGRTCGSGIATDAFDRARAFVARRRQAQARRRRRPRPHASRS